MAQVFGIGQQKMYEIERPVRDPGFLRFLRNLFCVACGSHKHVEAAHFGPHGLGQKSSDLDCLPVCRWCHRTGPNSYHKLGPRRFAEFHSLDVTAHQNRLKQFWLKRMNGGKAA